MYDSELFGLYFPQNLNQFGAEDNYSPIFQPILMQDRKVQLLENKSQIFSIIEEIKIQEKQLPVGETLIEQNQDVQSKKRCIWKEQQEKQFFKILAKHAITYPFQYLSWKKDNKKKVFINMSKQLKNKTQIQCKSKFNSYKRKHGNRKKFPQFYQKCMKDLIIKHLKIYSKDDKESQQILSQISEKKLQLEQYLINQITQTKKQRTEIQEIARELGMDPSIQYHTRSKIDNAVKEDACENVEKSKIGKLRTKSMSLESKCSTLFESLIEENI